MAGTIEPIYPSSEDDRGAGEKKIREAVEEVNSGLNDILDSENKVDPSKFKDGGVKSQFLKATTGKVSTSSIVTLTTVETLLPSASITVSPVVPSVLLVDAIWDFELRNTEASGAVTAAGCIRVDGAQYGGQALLTGSWYGGVPLRETVSQVFAVPLSVGSHTISMAGYYVGVGTAPNCNSVHTGFSCLLIAS